MNTWAAATCALGFAGLVVVGLLLLVTAPGVECPAEGPCMSRQELAGLTASSVGAIGLLGLAAASARRRWLHLLVGMSLLFANGIELAAYAGMERSWLDQAWWSHCGDAPGASCDGFVMTWEVVVVIGVIAGFVGLGVAVVRAFGDLRRTRPANPGGP